MSVHQKLPLDKWIDAAGMPEVFSRPIQLAYDDLDAAVHIVQELERDAGISPTYSIEELVRVAEMIRARRNDALLAAND